MQMLDVYQLAENFVFLYPAVMTIVWMVGGLYFFFRREAGRSKRPPILSSYPLVSVLIPAHNEEGAIRNTLLGILSLNYPNFEVIVIDDASKDRTKEIIMDLIDVYSKIRIICLERNMGKPFALRCGALASNGEILLTVDADAYLDSNSLRWMVWHFITGPRVGAVTGNPRVRNRTSILGKIQVGEYSTIIGMIKRSQRILGKVLTVSGVIVAFRKNALHEVDYWDIDMITDDINATWKLEKRFWDIRYEPNAICWILVPETVRGLWRQRVRWAQGGAEVIRRHIDIWGSYKQRRLWPVYVEYVVSLVWSYTTIIMGVFWIIGLFFPVHLPMVKLIPEWKGSILVSLCLVQFAVAMLIDRRYESNIISYLFWVVWYPFIYWLIAAAAAVWATPQAFFGRMGRHAVWKSPDRGIFKRL